MTDGDGDTLDDELVACPACSGTGLPPPDDFVNGPRCFCCSGMARVTTARAVAYLDANPDRKTDR